MTRLYAPRRPGRHTRHTLRDIDYHVTEWGETGDPLVVYLHGWGDTGSTFQAVVDALATPLRVVAPDWRGFGRTGHSAGGYWFPDYLADLDALLELYSPTQPVVLVGHSMGGNVAGLYAGVRPQRVRALINIEGFGLASRPPADAPGHYQHWLKSLRRPAHVSSWPDYEALEQRIVRRAPTVSQDYAAFVARQWATQDAQGQVTLRSDSRHRLSNPILYRREEAQACWSRIEADVRIIVGANSGMQDAGNLWLDCVSNSVSAANRPCRLVADVGHMIHFEAPSEVAQDIDAVMRH